MFSLHRAVADEKALLTCIVRNMNRIRNHLHAGLRHFAETVFPYFCVLLLRQKIAVVVVVVKNDKVKTSGQLRHVTSSLCSISCPISLHCIAGFI